MTVQVHLFQIGQKLAKSRRRIRYQRATKAVIGHVPGRANFQQAGIAPAVRPIGPSDARLNFQILVAQQIFNIHAAKRKLLVGAELLFALTPVEFPTIG